eukprot:CAMPEP_0177661452 /NCGR_PEP_ID=MMETSP0447-20121125/18689_1 /TAXON_ID=0 /ORGANISM="Stygamoeba regulata, Strain BSH-02190019" /LENGTH=743 /DNA_ID=CAMNT_0019166801 /DNA_START=84 /DNA_END=2318 /DNA_ORIENTATION=+
MKTIIENTDPDEVLHLDRELGRGAFSSVYLGTYTPTSMPLAVKVTRFSSTEEVPCLLKEAAILKKMQHRHICLCLGAWLKGDEIFIGMEFADMGSITNVMKLLERNLTDLEVASVMFQLTKALKYLHSKDVIHRDIKGSNVLLMHYGHVKLADFGISTILQGPSSLAHTLIGSPYWIAPEVIDTKRSDVGYGKRVDIWSLGITAIELAERHPPLHEHHSMFALVTIPKSPPPTLTDPDKHTTEFSDFLTKCLQKDARDRWDAHELLLHPFLNDVEADHADTIAEMMFPLCVCAEPGGLQEDEDTLSDAPDTSSNLDSSHGEASSLLRMWRSETQPLNLFQTTLDTTPNEWLDKCAEERRELLDQEKYKPPLKRSGLQMTFSKNELVDNLDDEITVSVARDDTLLRRLSSFKSILARPEGKVHAEMSEDSTANELNLQERQLFIQNAQALKSHRQQAQQQVQRLVERHEQEQVGELGTLNREIERQTLLLEEEHKNMQRALEAAERKVIQSEGEEEDVQREKYMRMLQHRHSVQLELLRKKQKMQLQHLAERYHLQRLVLEEERQLEMDHLRKQAELSSQRDRQRQRRRRRSASFTDESTPLQTSKGKHSAGRMRAFSQVLPESVLSSLKVDDDNLQGPQKTPFTQRSSCEEDCESLLVAAHEEANAKLENARLEEERLREELVCAHSAEREQLVEKYMRQKQDLLNRRMSALSQMKSLSDSQFLDLSTIPESNKRRAFCAEDF